MRPRVYTRRLSPETAPILLIYPLLNRLRGKRGLLITVWHRRIEIRW